MATSNVSTALFAEHKICILGHKVLREKAEPIEKFDDALKQRAERMFEVMEATGDGVGLAAPQIGCSERYVGREEQLRMHLGCRLTANAQTYAFQFIPRNHIVDWSEIPLRFFQMGGRSSTHVLGR